MPPRRLRIGVIVDRHRLARWQADALRKVAVGADLLVYSCRNSAPSSYRLRHAAYYLLNLFTIRNPQTRRIPWPADLATLSVQEFETLADGKWQRLPSELLQRLRRDRVDAIVKFGMGLLRIPPDNELSIPILSYHHGDPALFRGRPAGFYEMVSGAPVMGQVVQCLSDRLDAGAVVAFAETKVSAHSYRATLIDAYRSSPLILAQALANCLDGRSWKPERWGRAYRLPSNSLVLRFLLKQWGCALARLFYGLFKEKRWRVATVAIDSGASLDSIAKVLSQGERWQPLPTPRGYRFLADPFHDPVSGLLVEGFRSRSCRGEILRVGAGGVRKLSGNGGHFSYPATDFDGEQWHIIPEISEWSSASTYLLGPDGLGEPAMLRLPGRPALLDPTPFRHEGILYLFANLAEEGPSVLRLWWAESLHGEFAEHPASPIRISPHGSRMAGTICWIDGSPVRLGQDLRQGYGDGLSFFRISHIDRNRYEEFHIRDFRFEHCRGPHTLNFSSDCAAFDYYSEAFAPLAGFRRLRERRSARG